MRRNGWNLVSMFIMIPGLFSSSFKGFFFTKYAVYAAEHNKSDDPGPIKLGRSVFNCPLDNL